MADTSRTKSELVASFPDNVIGSITPQEMRDLVVSIFGEYGGIHTHTNATAQAVTGTPTKITAWNENDLAVGVTPDHTTDDLTIDVNGVYEASMHVCFSGTNSRTFIIGVYVDGVASGVPNIKRKLGTGGDVGSASTSGRLNLTNGQKVTAYVYSSDGGTSYVQEEATLSLKRIG